MKKADLETISKAKFVEKLQENTGINIHDCWTLFKATLDLIVEEVQNGNKIEFRGYFILGSKTQKPRLAQNPRTLEKVQIPERRVVYFKKGDKLKNLDGDN